MSTQHARLGRMAAAVAMLQTGGHAVRSISGQAVKASVKYPF